MGSMFGSRPKAPKPVSPPPIPDTQDEQVKYAREFEAKRRKRAVSRQNTILTERGNNLLGS